ncbi:hypothetical protein [Pandoraea sp. SD6-2]|uniref:hypothetical protein n=1 Tax=Pandoraea sp. SD6-2 TaxID=1286093 RepID=UPI00032F6EAE|nr:hypothetical protein [Pandoraea sp. SD6-2]EON10627.1 hypothetical protein C266_25415 [Pandoraea sp. SD6-2]
MASACSIDWKLVLEYLKVFLNWPMVAALFGAIALRSFSAEIKALINRISSFKLLGQEVAAPQQARIAEEASDAAAQPLPPTNPTPDLEGLSLTKKQVDEVRRLFESERAAARIWEYRYLNYFFTSDTQAVLSWIIGTGGASLDTYETVWIHRIANPDERKAILTAMQMHLCVQIEGPMISATDKGKEYAEWPDRRTLSANPGA